jgi:hypothetical protein
MLRDSVKALLGWGAVAAVPIVAVATVALTVAPPGNWPALGPAQWMVIAGNGLILEVALAIVVAALAGVASGLSWRLLLGTALFVGTSTLLMLVLTRFSADMVPRLAASHAALGAAVIGCAALGAAARACFPNELDAAACSLLTVMAAGFGVFVIGPAAIDLPAAALNLALVASPVVAVASAADIDLFRGDLLYHLSPIAHRQFDYPQWYSAAGLYFVVAAAAGYVTNLTERG